jgi:glucosylglycerate phosphorylase
VWTTFSADQVDLNYGNPAVLVAMTEVLLTYLTHGADIIRLDAIAFLWKRIGTACVHLAETHEVIRLWRALFDWVAPGALLITETNVPHDENVSYFGSGHDEAHLVYQFPLAPLVLSAFHLADASTLRDWARGLHTPSDTTSFFNFLGSHDGVGLRPAEGLLTQSEIQQLCELSKAHGGGVSWKTNADGTLSPYELNSVYFDALTEADSPEPAEVQVARFLSAQSILLALAGVPGIYVQALLGSRNWHAGVERHGSLRSINRQKLDRATLEAELDTPGSLRNLVFNGFTERIRARIAQPAFHPNGPQRVLPSAPPLFVLERTAPDGSSTILCVHNVSGVRQRFRSTREDGLTVQGPLVDVLSGRREQVDRPGVVDLHVGPYEVLWLRGERT